MGLCVSTWTMGGLGQCEEARWTRWWASTAPKEKGSIGVRERRDGGVAQCSGVTGCRFSAWGPVVGNS